MATKLANAEILHTDNACEGQKQWTVDGQFFFWTYRNGLVFSSDNWAEFFSLAAFDMRFQKRYNDGGSDWYFLPAEMPPVDAKKLLAALP